MRKIEEVVNESKALKAIVYRDSEWNEYHVKHYIGGIYQVDADYHTDDKADAQHSARAFVKRYSE